MRSSFFCAEFLSVEVWQLCEAEIVAVIEMVRDAGLEPAHLAIQEPKSCVSANFTSRAWLVFFIIYMLFQQKQLIFIISYAIL